MSRRRSQHYAWLALLMALLVGCAPVSVTPVPTSVPSEEDQAALRQADDLAGAAAILVVDFYDFDFQGRGENTGNCLAGPNGATSTSEGAGQSGSTGVASGVVTTTVAHGDLVYEHLKQQFGDGAAFTDMSPATRENGVGVVESVTTPEGTYVLAQVNIGDNFTHRVTDQINSVYDWLKLLGVRHFVVNLSIVVKACGQVFDNPQQYLQFVECVPTLRAKRELINNALPDNVERANNLPATDVDTVIRPHAEVLAAYAAKPFTDTAQSNYECIPDPGRFGEDSSQEPVLRRSLDFYENLGDDRLARSVQGIERFLPVGDIYYIAAAGNDGLDFPFAPAIFREVVSVGAMQTNADITYDPNRAEWIWNDEFKWSVPISETAYVFEEGSSAPKIVSGAEVTLRGTSFVAPKISYLTAKALLEGVPIAGCYPQMTYAADLLDPDWNRNLMTSTLMHPELIWENITASDLNTRCADFPNPNLTRPPS